MSISTATAREAEQLQLVAHARHLTASGAARTIRQDRRMSLSEVARACGVAPSTVMRWENGERRPRGEAGARYASVLTLLAKSFPDCAGDALPVQPCGLTQYGDGEAA